MKFLYALVLSALLISCSDSQTTTQEDTLTKEMLVGTWVVMMIDGQELITNEYLVYRFNSTTEDLFKISYDDNGSSRLSYTEGVSYTLESGNIYISDGDTQVQMEASISYGELCGETGNLLTLKEIANIEDGVDISMDRTLVAIQCDVDYSDDIIGLWEGVVIEGDDTEPFDTIRLRYKSGGTCDFYCQLEDGSWTLLEEDNVYCIVGNMLGSQWDETEDLTIAEIWECVISDETMVWRATRANMDNQAGFDLFKVEE